MVNDAKRPVQFVFAGKAHPHDEPAKRVLQQIAQMMRNPDFADKFVFIEDYDINVGRLMVQGVDVWLNNPRRPLEASGTSGMKVVLNGGLNLSILDGWWAEAYDGLNGFAIGTGRMHSNMDVHDSRDGEALYRVLLDEVIPLYYDRDRDGLPRGWIKRMKRTIRTLGWRFNADRMVMDYTLKCYIPAAAARRARCARRRKGAGRKLPLAAHAKDVKLRIVAQQEQVFVDGLRGEHPVEGVFVDRQEDGRRAKRAQQRSRAEGSRPLSLWGQSLRQDRARREVCPSGIWWRSPTLKRRRRRSRCAVTESTCRARGESRSL